MEVVPVAKRTVFVTDYTMAKEMDLEAEILAEIDAAIVRAQCQSEEEVLAQMVPCDAIITQWAPLGRKAMERAQRCRVISRNGIGLDNIDLKAAQDMGIAVVNVPAYCVQEVADHAMALVLALIRKVVPTVKLVQRGGWDIDSLMPIRRVDTQTLGIVGLGRIGSAVAARAKPFFKEIVAWDPFVDRERFAEAGVKSVGQEELWREADIVTLHVPHNESTHHLINTESLSRMKDGAYIVNTCRGAVVDTEALVEALRSGKLGGAGLDVHEEEPLPPDHPLHEMDNVIITPHMAFYSEESLLEARRATCENLVRFFKGEQPISRVV